MQNDLNQVQPTTQPTNLAVLAVLVVMFLWLVVPALPQGNSKQLSSIADLTFAISSLSELSKEKNTSLGTRSDIRVGSKLLNKRTINKLQVSTASLMSQAEFKLKEHSPNQKLHFTRIGPELQIKKEAKQLKLSKLKDELVERKLSPEPLKVVNLKLPIGLDTQRIFNAMDTNDDGELSQEEFKTSTKLPNADEHFNEKDAGNDGALSFDEFQDLLKPKSSPTVEGD